MTSIPDVGPDLEAAAKRVEELSEQVTAQAKANGLLWLEAVSYTHLTLPTKA